MNEPTVVGLLIGICKCILILATAGTLLAVLLYWSGFFEDRSFQCTACELYTYDSRWLVVIDGKNYCMQCYKNAAAGDGKAKFSGNCVDCGGEFPLAAMVGLNEKTLCDKCWRNRLWPKDWKAYFKDIRESRHHSQPRPTDPAPSSDGPVLSDLN